MMKRIAFTLLLLASFIAAEAQTDTPKFYAVDGSSWITSADRDKKEDLIWNQININIKAALNAGRLGSEDPEKTANILQNLFHECRMLFSSIRLANMGKDGLRNMEFRYFLSDNGVNITNGLARNGEIFNMDEYAFAFDIVLREYSFNAKIMEELADPLGKDYNINFIVNDFQERVTNATVDVKEKLQIANTKNESVLRLIPKYKAAKSARRK